MTFFKKSSRKNYDIFSGHSWYVPGVGGMFFLLGMLLVGALISNIVSLVLLATIPQFPQSHAVMIGYVLMFILPMIVSRSNSNRELMSGNVGYALDNNNFKPVGGIALAAMCMVATIACQVIVEPLMQLLPQMPESLKKLLENMTDSDNLLVNFLTLSIFAPFFEEWLCRGMVLRGLLNYRRRKDSEPMKPVWAIIISAAFFAVIHMNPWQAVPAFLIGLLLGYVYYRTGSLKLTMLMHFTNNTLSIALSNLDSFKEAGSIFDLVPVWAYSMLAVASVAVIVLLVKALSKIELRSKGGNCEELSQENAI
ncbi:MAG: CPBP family intramembrane metalloprotease [Bacteroidales bacterium]|nr:CPBP family intramembrane metalloprotease [Bacteroidales bacterium]